MKFEPWGSRLLVDGSWVRWRFSMCTLLVAWIFSPKHEFAYVWGWKCLNLGWNQEVLDQDHHGLGLIWDFYLFIYYPILPTFVNLAIFHEYDCQYYSHMTMLDQDHHGLGLIWYFFLFIHYTILPTFVNLAFFMNMIAHIIHTWPCLSPILFYNFLMHFVCFPCKL
jgi:hypothetical protein